MAEPLGLSAGKRLLLPRVWLTGADGRQEEVEVVPTNSTGFMLKVRLAVCGGMLIFSAEMRAIPYT